MKKNILSLTVIAAFALTLMASSAMAAPYIDGVISFSGNLLPLCYDGPGTNPDNDCSDYSGISAFKLASLDGKVPSETGANIAISFMDGTMVTPTGDFTVLGEAYYGKAWVDGFPKSEYLTDEGSFVFRNEDGSTMDNLTWVVSNDCSYENRDACGLEWGTINGFIFYIAGIIPDSFVYDDPQGGLIGDGLNDKFTMDLVGWVLHPDFAPTQFNIGFSGEMNSGQAANPYFTWGMTWRSDPPVVPEPGTLVLFGTGLIGATIVARRKMKK